MRILLVAFEYATLFVLVALAAHIYIAVGR